MIFAGTTQSTAMGSMQSINQTEKAGGYTKITKKRAAAVDRIIQDGRSIDAMLSGEIPTSDGIVITDGFVLVHSATEIGRKACKVTAVNMGETLHDKFLTAYKTSDEEIYAVSHPFELKKVASTLHEQCKQYQTTNRFKQSFITLIGTNKEGKSVSATFNVRHLINAFECVGRKAVGTLCVNNNLFNGSCFLLIEPNDHYGDLSQEMHAIVLQSKNSEVA